MASKILTKIKQRPFLAGGVATASLLFLSRRRRDRLPDGEIWLDMDLSQPLAKAPPGVDLSFLSGEPPPLYVRDVVDALEMAANDSKVRGVLGRFSYRSWGMGTLACVQEVRDAVTAFRGSGPSALAAADAEDGGGGQQKRPKKFTIAVADTFGEGGPAVGEYFLASAFEKILVQKSGYVGLTGAGAQGLFFRGFLDKYGIKPELFAREEYKNAADSIVSKAYSKHNREATTSLLTSILDNVADGIAASRGFGGRKDVIAIMQDCPLPAKAALSANLIDGIMYENDVASLVKNGFVAKPAGAESDAAGEGAAAAKEHALSTFADPGGDGEGGEGKCTRVSMRDYIKRMKEERARRGSRGMLDSDMLPDAAKGAAAPAAKTVALINVTGAITRFDGAGPRSGEGATSSTLCKRLEQLVDDKTVGAVVIRVDSPGGSAVASDSIAAAVRRVKAAGKPVVCSMGDVAASGGYMIAAACDAIVAQPTTITGSIGVIAAKLSVERLLKDWGIAVDSIELTENHLSFSALKAFTPKQRSLLDKRIGEIYADFVGDVAAGRKLPIEEVYKSAKGRVWTGQQALDRGLVDELGGLNKAIAIAKTKAGLPEEALVVGAKRKSLAQVATQMLSRGNGTGSSSIETGGDGGGVRTLALALADSVVGAEAMDAVFSAVSVLASVNDLAKGKMPGGRAARGELELDVDDL